MLAFTLLLFFSTMLWYLANGSLNEYLKSQIELQGHYYTGQKTTLAIADFSSSTGIASFNQLNLANLDGYHAQHLLVIDKVDAALSAKTQDLLTEINEITINKLILNIEYKADGVSNVSEIIQKVSLMLAHDYPELYPEISAKIYAENNPDLNAEKYAEQHPQTGPIIEHTKPKKKRGKPQQKLMISSIKIKALELNTINFDSKSTIQKYDVTIETTLFSEGLVVNQIGGEILLHLLKLANK